MARKVQSTEQQPDTPQLPPLGDGETPLPVVTGQPLIPTEINPYQSSTSDVPLVNAPAESQVVLGASASARRRWRVDATMPVMVRGLRTTMRFGKIIDELNYDVKSLQQQGLPMSEITE